MSMRVNGETEVQFVKPQVVDKENTSKTQGYNNAVISGKPDNVGEQTSLGNTTQKVTVKANGLDYSNFGGKARAQEAASYASNILDTVNDALKNLQKNYPGARVDLGVFPNPTEFSKKQFGKDGAYAQWKEEARAWRENSMTAINNYADKSHEQVVQDAAGDIKGTIYDAYASLKGGQLQLINQMIDLGQITKEGFNQLAEKMDKDTAKVIKYIRQATNKIMANDNRNAGAIIGTVNQRAAELHEHMDVNDSILSSQIIQTASMLYDQAEGNKQEIKSHVSQEANGVKRKVEKESEKIQEKIATEGEKVIDTLDPLYLNRAIKGLRDAAAAAGKTVVDFVKENPSCIFFGITGAMLLKRL